MLFCGFFLIGAAWAIGMPANGTYDEKQHVIRAYAAVTGQLRPDGTVADTLGRQLDAYRAPTSLLPEGTSVDCTYWRPEQPASCQHWSGTAVTVRQPSSIGRYNPLYYLPVGIPLLISPTMGGVVWARVVSALLSAAVLAAAGYAAMASRRRMLLLAVLATATPTTMNLAGAVNPNGLEIAAGILTATATLALLGGVEFDQVVRRRLICLVTVGAALLIVIRQLGPVLLAMIWLGCLAAALPGRIGALRGDRFARRVLPAGCCAAAIVAGGWVAFAGAPRPLRLAGMPDYTTAKVLGQIVTHRVPFFAKQLIAQFSYGETNVHPVLVVAWYLLFAAIVVPALVMARVRVRIAVVGLPVVCVLMLAAFDVHFFPRYGWFSQGRYVAAAVMTCVLLPAAVGLAEERLVATGRWTRFAAGVAGTASAVHLLAFTTVLARFSSGPGKGLDPFAGTWHPLAGILPARAGAAVPMLAVTLGGLVTTAAVLVGAPGGRSTAAARSGCDAI